MRNFGHNGFEKFWGIGINAKSSELHAAMGLCLLPVINKIINQKPVGGAIIQLPLPENLNRNYILNAIPREKDVDVLSERALGAFYTGRNQILPPSVGVVEEIMRVINTNLEIMKVVVIGPGFLIGQPIAVWLQNKVAELTILNKHTKDLKTKLKNADIIISGVGKANLFSDDDIKKEALIIDFGISVDYMGKIHGDFNAASINNLGFYTPTPGGTGPILVAKLFENFYKLCLG